MTTELEEQFYKTFGIEKREHAFLFSEPDGSKYYYPKITDRKLLEMICLVVYIHNYSGDVFDIEQNDINELKNFILHYLINYMKTEHIDTFYKNDEVKICVQQLFKEGE